MHGYPMSHIIEPMTLGRISLRLYASMNKEAALDAPSKHKNILIVVINGLVDMRDLKEGPVTISVKTCKLSSMHVYIYIQYECTLNLK